MKRKFSTCLWLVLGASLLAAPAWSTTMLRMDLADLTDRADRIFRGTVIDVEQSTIQVGGGEVPAVTYRFRVEDLLKGQADRVKDQTAEIEVQMVGSIKAASQAGSVRKFSVLYDVPRLTMGGDYVLFVTPRSEIGLSVTVGLGQGAFSVFTQNREAVAVNEYNNVGLGLGSGGPVSYSELTAKILALLNQ